MPFDGTGKTEQGLNLDLLCERILAAGDNFTLREYSHECGTPACIAGHGVALWPDIREANHSDLVPEYGLFGEKIGVPESELQALCEDWPQLPGKPPPEGWAHAVTGRMAVAALRRLRNTGEAYYDLADDVEGA